MRTENPEDRKIHDCFVRPRERAFISETYVDLTSKQCHFLLTPLLFQADFKISTSPTNTVRHRLMCEEILKFMLVAEIAGRICVLK